MTIKDEFELKITAPKETKIECEVFESVEISSSMEVVGDMNLVADFIAGYDGSITGRESENTVDENLT